VGKVDTMYTMFKRAESFNQNLCAWGVRNPDVNKGHMFDYTACENKNNDNWCVNSCN